MKQDNRGTFSGIRIRDAGIFELNLFHRFVSFLSDVKISALIFLNRLSYRFFLNSRIFSFVEDI